MNRKSTLVAIVFISIVAVTNVWSQKSNPKFSDWEPVTHLPPPINSEFSDQAPVLSKDEKTLFFTSNRSGSEDIWVSTRKNKNSAWRTPVNLGSTINTGGIERLRFITSDGRVMLFMSDREGSEATDLWATVRKNVNNDLGWSEPVNLGPYINSPSSEFAASYLFPNSGHFAKLFFSSGREGGSSDIYESTITSNGFEPAINVFELNSPSAEMCLWMRDDGLELLFISNRPNLTGDLRFNDLYTATRDSIYDPWSTPIKLGPSINAEGYQDVNPSLSFDGRTLMLASRRPWGIGEGIFDIYMTTRRRVSE